MYSKYKINSLAVLYNSSYRTYGYLNNFNIKILKECLNLINNIVKRFLA
jgi:hypothetical protein